MEQNYEEKNAILMMIIGLATLLIALIGATFAYFSVKINNNNAESISITTITPTALTYTGGSLLSLPNAMPGDKTATTGDTGLFTVENANTANSIPQTYDLVFKVDSNSFTKNHVAVPTDPADVERGNDSNSTGQLFVRIAVVSTSGTNIPTFTTTGGFTISGSDLTAVASRDYTDGTVNAANSSKIFVDDQLIAKNETHTYRLQIEFVDTEENQDENKGKTFAGHIEVLDARSATNQ